MLAGIGLILSVALHAQDRNLTYTYQSNVLPKGGIDIEAWNTVRAGRKTDGQNLYFRGIDQRLELEVGLGKNLQTSVYLNHSSNTTGDPAHLVDGLETEQQFSFSNEWKWKMSDPQKNKLGSALYFEWAVSPDEIELETKIILDKRINKNLFAFNGVYEYEIKSEAIAGKTHTLTESPVELDFAAMHFFNPHFGLGLELRNVNEISSDKGWEYSVWYGGPSLNVSGSGWFLNAAIQPQLGNLKKTTVEPLKMVLDEREKAEFRLLFGISL